MKALRKVIIMRSRIKTYTTSERSSDNWYKYKNQRNFCVKLLRKTKQDYFSNLDIKSVSDTKKSWKMIINLISVTKDLFPLKYTYLKREGL